MEIFTLSMLVTDKVVFVATELQPEVATIQIKDTLANEKQINITAHQLPIIDKSITVAILKEHDKLLDCFEGLREELKGRFEEILNYKYQKFEKKIF